VEFKKKQSDFVIKNNFRNNSIKKDVRKVLKRILLNA
jgi:dephospho-CoA kinase